MDVKTLQAEFEKGLTELKTLMDQSHSQVADGVEAKRVADDNAKAIGEAQERLSKISAQINDAQKALAGRIDAFEVQMNRLDMSGSGVDSSEKSLGDLVVDSDEYKSNGGRGNTSYRVETKALVTSDAASAGSLLNPIRVPGIISSPRRQPRMRDLVPSFTMAAESTVEFVKETRFSDLSASLLSGVTAGSSVDLTFNTSAGFKVGTTVTVGVGTANEETATVDAVDTDAGTITVNSLANAHSAGAEVTASEFIFTAEAVLKPSPNVVFEQDTASVKTLASSLTVTRQIIADATQLRAHINTRMIESLRLSEERQMLYGTGTGNEIQGVLTHPDVPNYLWSSGVSGDTKLDAIRRAMTLSQIAEYPVSGMMIHPTDWQDITLAKASDGHYQLGGVDGRSMSAPNLWGVPVVVTTAINPGTALIGAFALGMAIWDRESVNIRVSEHHSDHFRKNLAEILAEMRMTTTIYRPDSFVEITFDSAP